MKKRFFRFAVAIAVAGIIASQIPVTSNIAFAQGVGCEGGDDDNNTAQTIATVSLVGLAGAGIYEFIVVSRDRDKKEEPQPLPSPPW